MRAARDNESLGPITPVKIPMQLRDSSDLRSGTRDRPQRPDGKIPGHEHRVRLRSVALEVGVSVLEQEGERGSFQRTEGGDDARLGNKGLQNVAPNEFANVLPQLCVFLPCSATVTEVIGTLVQMA